MVKNEVSLRATRVVCAPLFPKGKSGFCMAQNMALQRVILHILHSINENA